MRRFTIAVTAASTLALGLLTTTPASASARVGDYGCTYVVEPPYPANLRVRSGPGTDYPIVDRIGYLETVEGSCYSDGDWVRVWTGCGGWSYAPYLREIGY